MRQSGACDVTKSKYLQHVRSVNLCTYGLHHLQCGLERRTCDFDKRQTQLTLFSASETLLQFYQTVIVKIYRVLKAIWTRSHHFKDVSPPTFSSSHNVFVFLVSCKKSFNVLSEIPMLSWLQLFHRPPHPISWGILFEEFHPMHTFSYLGWPHSAAGTEAQTLCLSSRLKNNCGFLQWENSGLSFHSQAVLFPMWIQTDVNKQIKIVLNSRYVM